MKFLKSGLATLLVAGASADETYKTNYDVSRSADSKNVTFVYQVSAHGSSTPSKNLGLAKNAAEEP